MANVFQAIVPARRSRSESRSKTSGNSGPSANSGASTSTNRTD